MKLMITGCCGHIGSYLTENLFKIKKIKKTILIDNLESNRFNSLFNLKKKSNFKFLIRDLKDNKSLDDVADVDLVIHLASMTNAEKSFEKKNKMYSNNIMCLKTVIKYCKRTKAKLIHISSTSVYGKQTKVVDETCEEKYLKPQSPYADLKLIEEKMLKKEGKFIRYNSFRFGTISGVSKGIRFHTAVNKFCFNAAISEKISVYKTALNQYRPYLSLKDAFKVFKFCIEKDFFCNDIFNVLSGNFTVNQILSKIKKYKKNISIKLVSSPIMNQLSYHVSQNKINKFGLILKYDIEKDIKDTIKLLSNI
jgi:UDP-glucose 4-epimerase